MQLIHKTLASHMGSPSLKKNFIYKSILTLSSYLMAFITFPYVSRILGVERLGLVNFVDNTVSYFLLFATMGIGVLGVREIASVRDNLDKRNRVYSDLFGLNIFFTILTLIVYVICISLIPRFHQYYELFYIGTAKIIFTVFLVEWFFSGIEDFKYITIRSVAVKSIYIASVFLFVKDANDYVLYWVLTVGVIVVNSLFNSIYIHRFVRFEFKDCLRFNYLRPNITLGVYMLMTSMYLTFNVMYLGLISDNTQVGYYTSAHKLYMVILGFFSAFTQVMLPRMSSLMSEGKNLRFQELVDLSFFVMFMCSVPLITCSMVLAPQIILILSGPGYEGAVLPMRIIMPAVFSVGIAQVIAVQVLMPIKKDKVLLTTSVIGALVALSVNLLVVPLLGSVGSAWVLLISETAVTISYIVYILRHRLVRLPIKYLLQSIVCAFPCFMICLQCGKIGNPFLSLIVAFIAGGGCWVMLCYLLGGDMVRKLMRR